MKAPSSSSDIAGKVRLFNETFAIAWPQITKNHSAINADTARWLAAFIRSKSTAGETVPEAIAAGAVKDHARRKLLVK